MTANKTNNKIRFISFLKLLLKPFSKNIFKGFTHLRNEKGSAFSFGSSLMIFSLISTYLIQIQAENLESIINQRKEKREETILQIQQEPQERVVRRIKMLITAYSSTPDQTDETPFITASGKEVKDGIVANNMLPFGTKIRIPELYGEKIFVVEDRLHWRKGSYHIDIWFPTREMAKNFGVKIAEIEILDKENY